MEKNGELNKKPGERLKEWRKRRGITQELFAERCRYSKTHISYIENGKRKMTTDAAKIFSEVLEVREKYLLGYDDLPTVEYYRSSLGRHENNIENMLYIIDNCEYFVEKIESDKIIETFTDPYSNKKVDVYQIEKWLIAENDNEKPILSGKVWDCPPNQMEEFFEDIRLYIIFRLQQLVSKCKEASKEEIDEWRQRYKDVTGDEEME